MAQMTLAKHDHMIKALASDRADQSLRMSVLPWRSRRCRSVANAHRSDAARKCLAIDAVPITDEIVWCALPTTCLRDLLGDPFGARVRSDAEPQDAPSIVSEDQQSVYQPEGDRRNHEKVDRGDPICMVPEERSPALRWWAPASGHVLGNRGLATSMPSLRSSPWMRG